MSTSATQIAPSHSLDAATFKRLHPRAYIERYLSEGFRPDGRETGDWRSISINSGSIKTAHGSALVRVGETTVVCGVKGEISEPDINSPHEGYIVPNIDLPALSSPKFKPGPPGEEAQILSSRINSILTSSDLVDLTSLCISPSHSAWVLYIDVVCINYDGNAFDAALIAIMAALRCTQLPKATFDEETGQTLCSRKETEPLKLSRMLIPTSYITLSSHLLPDPTTLESTLASSIIHIVYDGESGKVVSTLQDGAGLRLNECLSHGKERIAVVREALAGAK